jgi:hypothetical protein
MVTLARLIIFNAKRGGEAGRMTLSDFAASKKETPSDDLALTSLEKKLCDRYVLRIA